MRNVFRYILILLIHVAGTLQAQDTLTRKEIRREQTSFFRSGVPWTIEVPVWIPGFAGSFSYGDINVEGEDGVDPQLPYEPPPGGDFGKIISRLFGQDWYLKFVFLTKIAYEEDRFRGRIDQISIQ